MRVRETGTRIPHIVHYPVEGGSRESLYSSIRKNSPVPGGFAALTTFSCKWQEIRRAFRAMAWNATEVTLDCRIGVTLPGLDATKVSEQIAADWVPFYRKLLSHEMNHVRLYQGAIARMSEIGNPARFAALVEEANRVSNEYDDLSEHGILEGTVLGRATRGEDFGGWVRRALDRLASFS